MEYDNWLWMFRVTLISLFLFCFPSIALSQKDNWIRGHIGCGKFLKYCERNKSGLVCESQTSFAEGFLSGMTSGLNIPIEKYDSDGVKYYLINFCKSNPLKDTHAASLQLFNDLL